MYGPNYVKLSRVFAVELLSMFIGHYAALTTPGPIRPPLVSQPCHHRLHSPRPHPCTATPAARDPNLDSGNHDHDMSRLPALAYPNDAPIHGLTDVPPAYSQRILGVALAPRSRQDTATPAARDPNLDSGNHDMSRLSTPAYPNDAPIHVLTDVPLAYSQRILGVTPSPLALDKTRQHTLLATQTSAVVTTTCLDYLHSHIRTMRPSTVSPTYI
jgi:hypothetical protein